MAAWRPIRAVPTDGQIFLTRTACAIQLRHPIPRRIRAVHRRQRGNKSVQSGTRELAALPTAPFEAPELVRERCPLER